MMTFEELQAANAEITTTDIKGKAYAEVNQRIMAFRRLYPNGTIDTQIVSLDGGICTVKATVASDTGTILGVGHAQEKEGSTFINKTSYVENCETSAVGRALGMVGIGIGASVASYEEVANAIANQDSKRGPRPGASQPTETDVCCVCDAIVTKEFADKSREANGGKVYCTGTCRDQDKGESA